MLPVKVDTDPVAERTDPTARTEWRDGFADSLSEGDEEAVELFPVSDRDDFPQSEFSLGGCFRLDESQTIGDSMHVGIDTDSILAVTQCRNKICGFSSHPFEQEQLFYGVRHLSVVSMKNVSAEVSNSFGLNPIKPDRIDRSFDLLDGQL